MSFGQTATGAAIVLSVIQFTVVPLLPSQPPIVVHSLDYAAGAMVQDRTITVQGDKFPARWNAALYDADTDTPIPKCVGAGFWNYAAGHGSYHIPIDQWVGREGECTTEYLQSLNISVYGVASWHWGNDETPAFKSEVFRP